MTRVPVKIEFLFWEECPSHEAAWERLQTVLQEKGLQPEVVRIQIRTEQDAEQWGFYGSPTIRINGQDIDPQETQGQRIGLDCRIYHTPDGRVSPLPSEAMIRQAIEQIAKT